MDPPITPNTATTHYPLSLLLWTLCVEYSNEMIAVAGLTAALAAGEGRSWEQEVSSKIFNALGMKHSYANLSSIPQWERDNILSTPYEKGRVLPILNMDVEAPAGAVVSCLHDLLLWLVLCFE